MPDAYDLLPYTEHAYAESHPDHLAVMARLSGFEPPSLVTPRVLELGCGRGGNLLPMAASWPEATFVGVDRSSVQIRDAKRIADAAALRNVSFVVADFADSAPVSGRFDFVLCHGVYSWVPPATRPRLMESIRTALAERGIAYVSFNTFPGWYRRLAARDFLRFAARASFKEGPRQALEWLTQQVSKEAGGYRDDLVAVHRRLVETDAAYLTHEYLAEEHRPLHVATFLAEATSAGLSYLGDALPSETAFELLPNAVQQEARALDMAEALTLADFTRATAFRRALLVRADTAFQAPRTLDARALGGVRVASRLKARGDGATGVETFEGAGTTVVLGGLARDALRSLSQAAPRSVPCTELAKALGVAQDALATELFDLWLASPGLGLHLREPEFVTAVSERPRASPVARWHAIEGGPVTNAWHQEVSLPDEVVRFVLGQLDGQTKVESLVQRVRDRARTGEAVSVSEAAAVVNASLALLANAALLVG